ncbi:MAG: STAS domain-containing protein [Verrucomicrobiota bacterium]
MKISERNEQGVPIVSIDGDADLAVVPAFQKLMREKMQQKLPRLVVDFSNVTFANTPIWAVVVEYYQHARKTGSEICLAAMQDRVAASFNIVRLGDLIPHYETVADALASTGSSSA